MNLLDGKKIKNICFYYLCTRPSAREAVISLKFLMRVLRDRPTKNCYNCLMRFQLIPEGVLGGLGSEFGTLFPWGSGRLTPTTYSRENWNLTPCRNRGTDLDPLGRTCLGRLSQSRSMSNAGAFDVAKLFCYCAEHLWIKDEYISHLHYFYKVIIVMMPYFLGHRLLVLCIRSMKDEVV